MRSLYSFILIGFSLTIGLLSCRHETTNSPLKKVAISKENGKYRLYRNGKPFTIKGAAGYSHFSELNKLGGNTIRIWDTLNLSSILDSAWANNIAVIVGLPIPNNDDYMSYYNDPTKASIQYKLCKKIVNKFKNHPALLMWCVGNELSFPYKLSYNNFYSSFNDIVDMIHHDDPDHPVTTTILNFDKDYLITLSLRCNVDIISFNIFNRINDLKSDLENFSWFWNGPYLLTEWGIDGPWPNSEQTAWGVFIENTSTKKAQLLLNRYKQFVPVNDPRFLGAFIFFWGHKQETTPTWFSIFDEKGARSEILNTMNYIWAGKKDTYKMPAVNYMLVDSKGARDNILLSPGESSTAEVFMETLSDSVKIVDWQIVREDWYKENNINIDRKNIPLKHVFKNQNKLKATFISPALEGPYRISATIYDNQGNFATCNTPFYVVSDK
ncbi:glycoside hydrolase family 2 TIM barrel-domain containing protein [Spirosoma harenae]